MFNYISFLNPAWLWLLLLPLGGVTWLFMSGKPVMNKTGWIIRAAAFALLTLAAAAPVSTVHFNSPAVLALLDVSDSIDADAAKAAGLAVKELQHIYPQLQVREVGKSEKDHSRLADALLQAGAELRRQGGGIIYLLTDAAETDADLSRQCHELKRDSIPVEIKTFSAPRSGIVLRRAALPPVTFQGQTGELALTVSSDKDKNIKITIKDAGSSEAAGVELQLQPGEKEYRFPVNLTTGGIHEFVVSLPDGQSIRTATFVNHPYSIMLLSKHPETDRELLQHIFGNAAVINTGFQAGKLSETTLTVIGEGTASTLPAEVQTELAANLAGGMGLLLFTGHEQPAASTAQPFPLGEVLPVFFDRRNQQRTPTTALVVIIDTSGSMMGARIDMAKAVARIALERLRDCDSAGIVEFHGTRRWAAPLQSASNRLDINRALNRLNAAGGTVILPAFHEAYYALRNSDARLKHVLIITDGGVEEGPFEPLVKKMAEHGITLSTVMVGPGQESLFLSQLAQWGHGRFYQAANRFVLPELIFRQSGRDMLPAAIEGELALQVNDNLTRIAPVGALPPADGVLAGKAKNTADQLIKAGGKLPFLSRWQYGLGQCAVVNTDLNGKWTEKLHRNSDYVKFLVALSRTLPDYGRFAPLTCINRSVNRQLELEFADLSATPSAAPLELKISRNSQTLESINVAAVAPGRWVVVHEPLQEGVYQIDAKIAGNSRVFSAAATLYNSPEINQLAPDTGLISAINRNSAALPVPKGAFGELYLRPWFGIAALILFILQILIRRLPEISFRPRVRTALTLALALLPLSGFAQPETKAVDWDAALSGDYTKVLKKFPDKTDYQTQLFRGTFAAQAGLYKEAAAAFKHASELADTGKNRRFALILELQSARRAGIENELLDSWRKEPELDKIRSELLADELEDSGRFADALAFLKKYWSRTHDKSLRQQQQLIRLSEKCGQTELIRELYRQNAAEEPQAITPVVAWGRFELLAGHRDIAAGIYRQAIDRNNDPAILLALADAAEQCALDSEAVYAVEKAGLSGHQNKLKSLFFKAKLQFRRGHPDLALKIIGTIDSADSAELMAVAELYEQFGALDRAVSTYHDAAGKSGDAHGLIRAAMIEQNRGNTKKAISLWRRILATSNNPVTADQAALRVIELAEKDQTLPQLQQEFKALSGNKMTDKDMLFLARIFVVSQTFSELENLFSTQRKLQPEKKVALLQAELQCMLNGQQYARSAAILSELIDSDPSHRSDYLQQQAALAVETGNKELAARSISALESQFKNQQEALEFSAGIAAMMNDYARAASIYEQCLTLYPECIETWLSWASSLKKSNRGEEAIPVLLEKATKATDADEFGVMIDGLIDLQPSQAVLEQALTLVKKRIAADSGNIFYYRLAGDLAEDLNDRRLQQRLQLYSMIVSPADRVLVLRQLMQEAVSAGNRETAIDFGLLLCGLNEQLPVDLYQSLGNLLLGEKRYAAAERIFKLADQGEDNYTDVQMQMAAAYRDAGMLDDAERIIRELLIVDPDNIALHVESASMLEMGRHYTAAAEHYYFVLNLLISRQLSAVQAAVRRGRDSHNVSEIQRWFLPVSRALVHCCSMAPGNIAETIKKSSRAELAALDQLKTPPVSLDAAPKLKSWSELYRRIGFCSGQIAAANEHDRELLRRFPNDTSLREDLVRDRLEFGLYDSAREFAGNIPAAAAILRPYNDPITRLLVRSELTGAAAQVEQQIKELSAATDEKTFVDLAGFAIVLNRPDLLTELSSKWLAAAWQKGGSAPVVRCLEMVYNSLPQASLIQLLKEIENHYEKLRPGDRTQLAWILWQAGRDQLIPSVHRALYEKDLLESSDTGVERILAILQNAAPASRTALLNQVLTHRPPDRLARFIVELAENLPFESDRSFDDTLAKSFAKHFSAKELSLWGKSRYGRQLKRQISEIALSKDPESVQLLAAAALARNSAGDYPGALSLVREIIERIVENKKINYQTVNLIDRLSSVFQADSVSDGLKRRTDRSKLLRSAADTAAIVSDNPAAGVAAGLFARSCGDNITASGLLLAAWRQESGNLIALRNFIETYDQSGRWSDLRRELIQLKPESPEAQFFYHRQLCMLQKNLFFLPEAERSTAGLVDFLKAVQLTGIAFTAGDPGKVSRTVLRFYLDQRNRNHASPAFGDFLPATGGIDGFHRKGDYPRQSLYGLMGGMNLTTELEYIMKGTALSDRSAGSLFAALQISLRPEGERQRLQDEALIKLRSNTLTATELLIAAAANAGRLDNALANALAGIAGDPAADPELTTEIIKFLPPAGRPGLIALQSQRFLTAARRNFGRNSTIARNLSLLPDDTRQQLAASIVRAARPVPFAAAADNTEIDRLILLKSAAPALLPKELEALAPALKSGEQPVLALLLDNNSSRDTAVTRFISNYVNGRTDDAVPPWEQIIALLPDDAVAPFFEAAAKSLENALQINLLTETDLVRNYAWLAVQAQAAGQKTIASNLLAAAERRQLEPGEQSLWIIDARQRLGISGDTALEDALISRQLLPPARLSKILSVRPELLSAAKALELSSWTHHPEVIRRALPAARPGHEKQELERALEFYNKTNERVNSTPKPTEKSK